MRYSKVFAVNPPSPPGYTVNRDSMGGFGQLYPEGATILPPLDLPYLAAYLRRAGVPVEVLESLGLELDGDALADRIRERMAPGSSALAAVRVALCSLDWDLEVAARLKRQVEGLDVAVYGPVVPQVKDRIRGETGLDFIVCGEPDETVREMAAGEPLEQIAGLERRREGGWIEGPPRPLNRELDELPFPAWDLLPYERYALPRSSTTAAVPFLPMLTSRGCPFGCHYCPYPVGQGLRYRYRSPANVVDEIEHLVNDLGIEYILFRDPIFSIRQDRVVEICEEIVRRGIRVRWKCETRPDCVDDETLEAMARAGCESINFGVESADVDIQKRVGRKPIPPEQITRMVDRCRELGIKTFCFFIIGLPGDTVDSILSTIDLAIHLDTNWVQFTAASPFVGTKLREWAVAEGLVSESAYAYRNSHETMMGNGEMGVDQIRSLHRFAKFMERYLINRGGMLKDETRSGALYQGARLVADRASELAARGAFSLARRHFGGGRTKVEPRVA